MKKKKPIGKRIWAKFINHPTTELAINWTKNHSFPGLHQVSLYDTFVFIYKELMRDSLVTRANSMAFNFVISIFPSIIVLFTLIPFLLPYIFHDTVVTIMPDGHMDFNATFEQQVRSFLPDTIEEDMMNIISELATKRKTGLLSLGFLLAIYFSSNGMLSMMQGFEKSYATTFKKRNVLEKRLIAILLTSVIGMMVIVVTTLIVFGNLIISGMLDRLEIGQFTGIVLNTARYLIIILALYTTTSIIYKYGASTFKRFNMYSIGASLATFLTVGISIVFSIYIDNFAAYNKLYGGIGTLIISMLYIQILCIILLLGYELNASIAVNRDLREERED